jgi:hypothetical protein
MKLYQLPDGTIIDLTSIESITRVYEMDETPAKYDVNLRSRAYYTVLESELPRDTFVTHLTSFIPQ